MSKPVIHLLSVAGSDADMAGQLGLDTPDQILEVVQMIVGPDYRVTGNRRLMGAVVDELQGGRSDDAARVRELQRCLADERITALVSLRGGAWLTRVLPHVDFNVLRARKTQLYVFGFSEFTPLVNIVARYPKVRAHYDLGPGYLLYGLRNYALACAGDLMADISLPRDDDSRSAFAAGWAKAHFRLEFAAFFLDVVDIIAGRGSNRPLTGELVSGRLKKGQTIKVIGGCLSTMLALLGSGYQRALDARDMWLAIEDIREDLYRIDRFLAQLKLAGVFEHCAGLLLGPFNQDGQDHTDAVLQLLPYHLPPSRRIPIIARCNFGHCYPVASLPLNHKLTIRREPGEDEKRVTIG